MVRYVDYSPEGAALGRCVVLPGRQYTPDGPLLFFAAQAALSRGWAVRQVWWDSDAPPRFSTDVADEMSWVSDQLDAAVAGYDGRLLVVAKSLGTLAAPYAAAHSLDAAWLTPLLTEPAVADVLVTYPARQFVAIGSDDPYLSRTVFDALPGERVLVPGDHVLRAPGDVAAMVASHDTVVRAFDAWLRNDLPQGSF